MDYPLRCAIVVWFGAVLLSISELVVVAKVAPLGIVVIEIVVLKFVLFVFEEVDVLLLASPQVFLPHLLIRINRFEHCFLFL